VKPLNLLSKVNYVPRGFSGVIHYLLSFVLVDVCRFVQCCLTVSKQHLVILFLSFKFMPQYLSSSLATSKHGLISI
jgi:hypothetical protein